VEGYCELGYERSVSIKRKILRSSVTGGFSRRSQLRGLSTFLCVIVGAQVHVFTMGWLAQC
jgi:hypothetical protein